MPIERLPGDPELFAKRADIRLTLSHARHGEPELRRRHLRLAASDPPARASGCKSGSCALYDELALELGERGEDAEDEFASGGRRVDRRALAGENAQPDAGGGELVHGVDEVAKVTAEPIELPHDKCVSLAAQIQFTLRHLRSGVAVLSFPQMTEVYARPRDHRKRTQSGQSSSTFWVCLQQTGSGLVFLIGLDNSKQTGMM